MDTYLLMLLVTVEQEEAIKFLYEQKGWKYIKTGSRAPVKEELEYLYENVGPEKTPDGVFRIVPPYLPISYLDHPAAQQFPAAVNFARTQTLPYGVHDFSRNSSQLYPAMDGGNFFPGVSVSSSEMSYESSTIDSVSCISKSLTILDNMDTDQYSDSMATEQISTHSMPLDRLSVPDKTTVTSGTMTPVSLATIHSASWLNTAASSQTLTSSSGNKEMVSSFDPGTVACRRDTDVKCDNDTDKDPMVEMIDSNVEQLITEQTNPAFNLSTDIETKTKMLLKNVRKIVKEFQDTDIANDAIININEIQNEVSNLIQAQLENRRPSKKATYTQMDANFIESNLDANESHVVYGSDQDNFNEVCSERNAAEDFSDDHGIDQGTGSGIGKVITANKSSCDDDPYTCRTVGHKKLRSKKSNISSLKKRYLDPNSEPKTNAWDRKDGGRNNKTDINRTRKHHWAVNRNIRMHGYHRKCKEIPADLDVNSYSVAEKGYFCPDCLFVFKTEKQLKLHKELKGGICSPECLYCDKDNLKDIFQCVRCPKCFKTKELLEKHMERHTLQNYQCDFCQCGFYTATELRLHIQSSHAKESKIIYLCDLCGANFNEKKVLNAHRKYVHTDERPEVCHTCGSKFKTKSQLKNHLIKHKKLEEINLSCEICGKMFLRMATLKDHVRRHNKDFAVFCPICGKGFYRKYGLEEHMRAHTGSKPYECKICSYKCALRCNLMKHMKIHTNSNTKTNV